MVGRNTRNKWSTNIRQPEHWLTNFDPKDGDNYSLHVKVAKSLKHKAWIGPAFDGLPGSKGFYIDRKGRQELGFFWHEYEKAKHYKYKFNNTIEK